MPLFKKKAHGLRIWYIKPTLKNRFHGFKIDTKDFNVKCYGYGITVTEAAEMFSESLFNQISKIASEEKKQLIIPYTFPTVFTKLRDWLLFRKNK